MKLHDLVNLTTAMQSLVRIARARPSFMATIVSAMEALHANLPPTLTMSQVGFHRAHLTERPLATFPLHSLSLSWRIKRGVAGDVGAQAAEDATVAVARARGQCRRARHARHPPQRPRRHTGAGELSVEAGI